MKTLLMTQRIMDDSMSRKTNDKIKMTKMLKLRWRFKALINRT